LGDNKLCSAGLNTRGALIDSARQCIKNRRSEYVEAGESGSRTLVFADSITPPPTLMIVGTGHDVDPVIELAEGNGFKTTVAGYREKRQLKDSFRTPTALFLRLQKISAMSPILIYTYTLVKHIVDVEPSCGSVVNWVRLEPGR
jgi:xanthine/CO dehydrogenase XdhC/CoxF family maturation factor